MRVLCGKAATAILALLGSVAIAFAQDGIIVTLKVDASYPETAAAMERLDSQLQILPLEMKTAAETAPLEVLVERFYGLDSSRPQTVRALAHRIAAVNNVTGDVPAGTPLQVPAVPPLVRTMPGRLAEPAYGVLTSSATLAGMIASPHEIVKPAGKVFESGPSPTASSSVVIAFPVSRELLETYRKSSAWTNAEAKDVSGPMTVRLNRDEAFQADPVWFTPSIEELGKLELGATRRESVLVVLDAGFPSESARDDSATFFRNLFADVHLRWVLGEPQWNGTMDAWALAHDHPRQIAASIAGFDKLTAAAGMKVVYVPLSRAQGAAPMLRELFRVAQVLDLMQSRIGEQTPSSDLLDRSARLADFLLQSIPANITGNQFQTNRAVLEALVNVLNLYVTGKDRSFFLNLSWTIDRKPNPAFDINLPAPAQGAIVVAVGNEKLNVMNERIDFGRRSGVRKDVLAVMNFGADGMPTCDSSTIDVSSLPDVFAVGYDGAVTTSVCGSSFSAPRVAWTLAFAEAFRVTPIQPDQWSLSFPKWIRAGWSETQSWPRFKFDPIRYFKIAIGSTP